MEKNVKNSCVYCSNIEIKKRTIIENYLAWVFPTNIPIVPGHILIAPKRCVAKYEDLTAEEKESIEELRLKIIKALKKAFKAEGFNYAWNENKIAGQSVPHFHLHVLPRKEGDEGITEYEPRKFLYRPGSREATPEKELQEISEIIKKFI
ncbi:HIT domain-containing protein [Candidatus Nomurabacteria bacterium]|nr:HIT domain-containing protein [Candidatus Nomurabacteria bacterium]